MFDLGDLISLAIFMGGLITAWIVQDRRITRNSSDIKHIDKRVDDQKKTIDDRLTRIEGKLDGIYKVILNKKDK